MSGTVLPNTTSRVKAGATVAASDFKGLEDLAQSVGEQPVEKLSCRP